MKIRVLLSAYACLPYAGTEPGNGWNWALHLAARGMDVQVLTVEEGREAIEAFRAEHPELQVSFSYVPVPRWLRHTTGKHYAFWQGAATSVARRLHRTTPFDLVHHVTYSSIHVPTQLWRLGLPTLFGPVGGGQTTPSRLVPLFGRAARAERLRTLFTRALPYSPWHRAWLRKPAVVLTTNTDTYRLAKKLGAKRIEPWFDAALPDEFFAPRTEPFHTAEQPVRLFWIGRMVPRKALPLALDVLARTRHAATLTIAGDGLPAEQVREMIAARGLTERVHWSGRRLDREEVRHAYQHHDALLLTSLRDSCPAQLVEAMGLGLPVITLDQGGAHDLVPPAAGIKVPVTTPEGITRDLASAIDDFAARSDAAKGAMAEAGWQFARTLTYTQGAELFEALYRQLLQAPQALTAFQPSARHIHEAESWS